MFEHSKRIPTLFEGELGHVFDMDDASTGEPFVDVFVVGKEGIRLNGPTPSIPEG